MKDQEYLKKDFQTIICKRIKDVQQYADSNLLVIKNALHDAIIDLGFEDVFIPNKVVSNQNLIEILNQFGINTEQKLKELLEPSYFAVIPLNILENKELSANTKLLYAEILALSKKSGRCYATNEYIAERMGLSRTSITSLLKQLKDKHMIDIKIKRDNRGTHRDIYVCSQLSNGQGSVNTLIGGPLDNGHNIDIDKEKLIIDNIVAPPEPQKIQETKPYNYDDFWSSMYCGNNRLNRVISIYWINKKFKFETHKQAQEALIRSVKAAKKLVDYDDDKIGDVMSWLNKNVNFKWTLETVSKYIDEDLDKIKTTYGKN